MTQPTLLFGTDLGEGASPTVDAAAAFARSAGYELALVCAYGGEPDEAPQTTGQAVLQERLHEEGERLRAALRDEVARLEAAGTRVRSARLRVGRPDEALLAEATELGATTIGIGPHTKWGGILDRLFGSTAVRVIRAAACPVLVLPSPPTATSLAASTIVVGLGGVPVDLRAIDLGLTLAERADAQVIGLHVGDDDRGATLAADHLGALPPNVRLRKIASVEGASRDAADVFLDAAKVEGAALLVLGAKPLPIGARVLTPSFVERACRHASVPVLVVP